MKYLILFSFLILSSCNEAARFKAGSIYVLGKGSSAKNELIAQTFNVAHEQLTHVAIGFVENEQLKIFEILPPEMGQTLVTQTSWKDFYTDEYTFLGVWEAKSDAYSLKELKAFLENSRQSNIAYDFMFDLNSDDKLYCSELVVKAINRLSDFNIAPIKRPLLEKHKILLRKDTLEYYPVDFFIDDTRFKKILEL